MRTWTVNSNPDDFDQHMKTCKKAYEAVSRYEEWKPWWEPIDANLNYSRSCQLWYDIEEGEIVLELTDFELAKEYCDYMDNLGMDYEEYCG